MEEPYVPIESIAKHLSVSISTIRVWVKQSVIPTSAYIKIGNTYRFKPSSVVEALHKADGENREPILTALKEEISAEEQLEFNFDEDQ